jgi:opacity protein-like surface antigen
MNVLFAAVLVVIASIIVPGNAFAQSNDAILQRLDALEKENATLRDRVRRIESRKQASASVTAIAKPESTYSTAKATAAYASVSPVYKATAPAAPAVGLWTGFYVGAHGGYTVGHFLPATVTPGLATDVELTGGFGGLQTGYNYQFAPHWLVGVEQDISFGKISGSQAQTLPNPTINASTNYSGTVRERFGYVWDRLLVYETAGIAWANNKVDLQFQGSPDLAETHLQFGVALGVGMEWAINPDLSVKLEYLYSYIAKEQYFAATPFTAAVSWPLSTVSAGVNWHFN